MSNQGVDREQIHDTTLKTDLSLSQLFHLIQRGKRILLFSTLCTLTIALLYNTFSTPLFESYIIVKKEKVDDRPYPNKLEEMFSMQTMDALDTEIEIIKTRTVLEKVIEDLQLSFNINSIVTNNGKEEKINLSLIDYLRSNYSKNKDYPQISRFDISNSFEGGKFYIQKSALGKFELFQEDGDLYINSFSGNRRADLDIQGLKITIDWPGAAKGDRFYIDIKNSEELVKDIQKRIYVSAIGKTNLVKLAVRSTTPQMAKKMVSAIIENYREVRLEQKRQNVLSSFEFVDTQVKDIEKLLDDSENELSQFKSANKVVIIDENSKESIKVLSNLESEKTKTELELTEYRSKVNEIKKVLEKREYFDQTYLTPARSDGRDSPFSILLQQLSDAEIQRLSLRQKRKESHPDVIAVNDQIAKLKVILAEHNKSTLTSFEIIIRTLEKKRSNLNRLIAKHSEKLGNIPKKESELIRLTRKKNVYEKMFTLLLDKREELRLAELSKMQDIIIVESARLPLKPVEPKKVINSILSILAGVVLGSSIILIKEIFNKKFSSLDDIENNYPYPILTIIPKYNNRLEKRIQNATYHTNRLVNLMEGQSVFLESYRVLGIKIRNFTNNKSKAMLISSCEENTGKTSIVINFAISLARSGKNVLILDCHLRKSSISRFLDDSSHSPGIIDILSNGIYNDFPIKILKIDNKSKKRISYIPAGGTTEDSSEILDSEKLNQIMNKFSKQYDHILIDTPPLTRIVDTLVLGKYIKDLIIVLRPHHTYMDSLALALEELNQSKMNLIGFIINAADIKKLSSKYKYGYGYGNGYGYKTSKKLVG